MNLSKLERHVRKTYFPLWDKDKRWRIRFAKDDELHGAQGKCLLDKKTIILDYLGEKLLIHEVCHAVAAGHHGKRWQERFLKAADKAEVLGFNELAEEIWDEVEKYKTTAIKVVAEDIYNAANDYPYGKRNADFDDFVDWKRRDYGFERNEFLRRFPRARKFFDEGKNSWENFEKARQARQEKIKATTDNL